MAERTITADDLGRWAAMARPFPLPEHLVPRGGVPLSEVPNDVLLNTPPHLITHLQRTAAQGGLQIISPRQTPFSCLMVRTPGTRRQLGDHIVGVSCDAGSEWPTIDNADFSHLLPDEPLCCKGPTDSVRTKTRSEPLTQGSQFLSDPVLSCLVKGRAVIDVLRRDDVSGGADAMTTLLADAWGVSEKEVDDLDAFTLGVQGPLLRHAIKADDVFPMIHAPIQLRRIITVGVSEVTRELLPTDAAMDWRRMRVFAEAVYAICASVEGHNISAVRTFLPPGDPTADANRHGVMSFLPAPCTVWTFEPETFSIYPKVPEGRVRRGQIPREVLFALARYVEIVRPATYLHSLGYKASAKRTVSRPAFVPTGETIGDMYSLTTRLAVTGSARGRSAAGTVRNAIYEAIENADLPVKMRVARYIEIAYEETKTHLGLREVPDSVIDRIAIRFLTIGELIRMRIGAEAARRGATIAEWWADIVAQAPLRYQVLAEGTQSWARVGMWLIFRAPTTKWIHLVTAVKYEVLRDAERNAAGKLRLPAEKGSVDRLVEAARQTTRAITTAYSGYYIGVSDVGMAIADAADEMGQIGKAQMLREAAYTWHLRARCLRGTNVHPIAKQDPTPSMNHLRIAAEPVDLLLKPSPYRAFEAYKGHALKSKVISTEIKRVLRDFKGSKISECFRLMNGPICSGPKSTLTRFVRHPMEMTWAMEKAWGELVGDLKEVAKEFGPKEVVVAPVVEVPVMMLIPQEPLCSDPLKASQVRRSYFDMFARLGPDEIDWAEEVMDALDPADADEIYAENFGSVEELRERLLGLETQAFPQPKPGTELVR